MCVWLTVSQDSQLHSSGPPVRQNMNIMVEGCGRRMQLLRTWQQGSTEREREKSEREKEKMLNSMRTKYKSQSHTFSDLLLPATFYLPTFATQLICYQYINPLIRSRLIIQSFHLRKFLHCLTNELLRGIPHI